MNTSENSELGRPASGIAIDLELSREDWFFVVFGETSRDDRLPGELVDSSSEIGCDKIFHDAILDRVK